MVYITFGLVSFFASVIGSICGIGGGVIIKPTLDAFQIYSAATISLMCGCTVLAMAACSICRILVSETSYIRWKVSGWLGVGAATGGIIGGALLSYISSQMGQPNLVGASQAVALFAILAVTLLYMRNESKVQTLHLARSYICLVIGFALGVCSSFLGIGGGPLNLVVLYYFFSMQKKEAAQNSLFIILIAQAANLMYAACRQKIPSLPFPETAVMLFCGVAGGIFGRRLNQKLTERSIGNLLFWVTVIIMLICCYNFIHFCIII